MTLVVIRGRQNTQKLGRLGGGVPTLAENGGRATRRGGSGSGERKEAMGGHVRVRLTLESELVLSRACDVAAAAAAAAVA